MIRPTVKEGQLIYKFTNLVHPENNLKFDLYIRVFLYVVMAENIMVNLLLAEL